VGKIWVLDTETKGTGANMVPLERTLKKPASDRVRGFVFAERKPPAPPAPPGPRQFKVLNVVTREVLAEGADARTTIALLEQFPSIVDVIIWVWNPSAERWRMLSLDETRVLWDYRGRASAAPSLQ
jgi:hypothetical protein